MSSTRTLAFTLALAIGASGAEAQTTPDASPVPGVSIPVQATTPAQPRANQDLPVELQLLPRPMPLARVLEYLAPSIAEGEAREEFERRVTALWNGYAAGFELVESAEFREMRLVLAEVTGKRPPTPDTLRAKYASALAGADRLDAQFLADVAELRPNGADPAMDALRRARTRNVSLLGLAGHLSLSVPIRWRDPMGWLEVTETRIPIDAIRAFDEASTEVITTLTPVRRRFEFNIIVSATTQQRFVRDLPSKAAEFVDASRDAANATRAAVETLRGALPPEDIARVHIARIEDLYFDTPRPERPCGTETFPADPALQDAWFAERAKLALADAAILARYEEMALKTLAATPLWDREAYDGRQFLAKNFKDERTQLHDETRTRLELLSGRNESGG
ncbi:MAG: hypothetical protein ACO31E_07320 [Phycisphaerales bacterium]